MKRIKQPVLDDARKIDIIFDGGSSDDSYHEQSGGIIYQKVTSFKVACIDNLRGFTRLPRVFFWSFFIVCVLYTSITYGKDFFIEKPVLNNPCKLPSPGLSILHFPPQNDDETSEYSVGRLFEFSIFKNYSGVFQITYEDKNYDTVCFKAGNFRGIRLRTSDVDFWRATLTNNAILTVTKNGKIEHWFTEGHTNDEGATS